MYQRFLSSKLTVIALGISLILITISVQRTYAQEKPLTLAQVLTGLQAKTGDFTLAEKNQFISQQILSRGVTFKLTPVIENELKQVGASTAVLRAIRLKAPRSTRPPTPKRPRTQLDRIWVDQNTTQRGVRGILVHAKFNVYNLKGVNSQFHLRIRDQSNQYVRTSNKKYANTLGHLALYRTKIKPRYSATVFKDIMWFIPYKEINLSPGTHSVNLVVGIRYNTDKWRGLRIGGYRFTLNQPIKPSARFSKLWVKYGKKQNGKLGLIVHLRFNVNNLLNFPAKIAVGFAQRTSRDPSTRRFKYTALRTSVNKYRSPSGQVTLYQVIRPQYVNAVYKDLKLFVPYEAFGLSSGKHVLKLHADLIYLDGSLLQHFGEKLFSYSKR